MRLRQTARVIVALESVPESTCKIKGIHNGKKSAVEHYSLGV